LSTCSGLELSKADIVGLARLAVFKHLADAEDDVEARGDSSSKLLAQNLQMHC
jgi:hypothetical protein